MKSFPILTTDRLILRNFTLADAPEVKRMAGDVAIAKNTLNMPHPYVDGVAEEWINSLDAEFLSDTSVVFAVTLKETGKLTGAIGLMLKLHLRNAEMGYWMGKEFWNMGYTTEAAIGVIQYAFKNLPIHKICANHFHDNEASGKVMLKAGMHYEATLKEHLWHWNTYKDLMNYAIFNPDNIKE